MTKRCCTVLLASLLAPMVSAVAQDIETTKVAEGVYQFRWNSHNGMFVHSAGRVVAFDPINPEAAAAFGKEIQRVLPGARLAAIVYSHSDADHSTGAPALMAAFGSTTVPIIAHERAVAPIRARNDANHPVPTVTFAERMAFDIAGRRIELHYLGPSHTDNMLVGFIPDVGVAFAVDFVALDRVGYQGLPGWRFPEFFDALSGMLRIPFQTVVFGHGATGDRDAIRRQIAYYDDLTAAMRKALADGLSEDQAVAQVTLPAYQAWGQYQAWMPMNARAIYQWLAKGER